MSDQAATVEQSVSGAAEKMKHLLNTTLWQFIHHYNASLLA